MAVTSSLAKRVIAFIPTTGQETISYVLQRNQIRFRREIASAYRFSDRSIANQPTQMRILLVVI